MPYPHIPPRLLGAVSLEWNRVGNMVIPGQTLGGSLPRIRTDGGGLWEAIHSGTPLQGSGVSVDADDHRAFRALRVVADDGASPIVMPRVDIVQPWPVVDGVQISSYGSIPFDDGSLFDDNSGFAQPVIDAATVASATLRSTSLRLQMNFGADLRGGECFSIEHPTKDWRMYEIGTAILGDDGYWTVNFLPPLREAVDSGTRLEFDVPRCLMLLKDMTSMRYRIDAPWFSNPTISLIEAPP